MKTLGKKIILSACAVAFFSSPLLAVGGAKAGTDPAASPIATPPRADGQRMDGGVVPGGTGPGIVGPGATGPGGMGSGTRGQLGMCDSPWGRRGPDADATAKLKKVEELEKKSAELGAKLREAAPGAQAAAKAELRKTIGELIDAKFAIGDAEAAAIEKRAAGMRARLEKRKAVREALIEKKAEDLAGDDQDDWD